MLKTLSRTDNIATSRKEKRIALLSHVLNYSEKLAIVEKPVSPFNKGRVRYQGTSWLALCKQNLSFKAGDRVLVVGRQNITLVIEPFVGEY